MDDTTIGMIRLALYFFCGLFLIFMLKRRSDSGIDEIQIDDEVRKTGLELEIGFMIPRWGNIEFTSYAFRSTYCQIYFTDKEIILEQTGYGFMYNNENQMLPMVICGKNQNLQEKYPKNFIANVVDLNISPWNDISLKIKMIQHNKKTIKLNMAFKSNKQENTEKLKKAIEEMMK